MSEPSSIILDPLIHEAARLAIISALNECGSASFSFLIGVTGLTRGNLSTHAAKLIEAGYLDENKQIADRKLLTTYRLTPKGRKAFEKYRNAWILLTSNGKP